MKANAALAFEARRRADKNTKSRSSIYRLIALFFILVVLFLFWLLRTFDFKTIQPTKLGKSKEQSNDGVRFNVPIEYIEKNEKVKPSNTDSSNSKNLSPEGSNNKKNFNPANDVNIDENGGNVYEKESEVKSELVAEDDTFGEDSEGTELEDFKLLLYKDNDCSKVTSTINYNPDEPDKWFPLCNLDFQLHEYNSIKVVGGPEIDFFSSCRNDDYYIGSLFRQEGCFKLYNYPKVRSLKFVSESSLKGKKQISDEEMEIQWENQDHNPELPSSGIPKARFLFSCESSEYFGYQVWANLYGYYSSKQKSASWTRLLTSRERDDLANVNKGLATFQAKRGLYSRRYSPINKPDIISKYMASTDRPKEEIMVVIDTDNWLVDDVSKWVDQVSLGNAIGEPAYYHGSKTAQKLWKERCRQNCDLEMDLVGVPYIVHREDLAKIAPLWRSYTIEIKDLVEKNETFKGKYGKLDLAWASEMFGYNMASAHLGIKHKVVSKIQVRDIAGTRKEENLKGVAMIHMGRAWFPKNYAPAQKWAHTEGKSFSHFGQQVWCKCNYTASTIQPWPVPPNADFQSKHTLEMMHYANERFGPIPVNLKYRRGARTSGDYHHAIN